MIRAHIGFSKGAMCKRDAMRHARKASRAGAIAREEASGRRGEREAASDEGAKPQTSVNDRLKALTISAIFVNDLG
jgi:hypothetical protein